MTINERVRYLRKDVLDLNQAEFCETLGLRQSICSMMESGERCVIDRTVGAICREFNVREEWLRTGEGEIFCAALLPDSLRGLPLNDRAAMEQAAAEACCQLEPDLMQAFLRAYAR